MTTAGDQVASVTVLMVVMVSLLTLMVYNLRLTITVTNAQGDSTGSGAALQAVTGGEKINGNGWSHIESKESHSTEIRNLITFINKQEDHNLYIIWEMAALLTDQFGFFSAQKFIKALEGPNSTQSDADAGSSRDRLYIFIGRPTTLG